MNPADSNQQAAARIVLVDDHPVVLDGYRSLLSRQAQFEVCATAGSAPEAVAAVEREHPQLVITDLTMPGRSGLDLIKDLAALDPTLKILVISMHDETLWAERSLKAGAKGYLMKDCDSATLVAAARAGPPPRPWNPSATANSRSSACSAKAAPPRKSPPNSTSARKPWPCTATTSRTRPASSPAPK